MRDLSPVLVANRGEIAIRIARTAHQLGLATVGVVTAEDAGAAHADLLDAVVPIGSYLDRFELLRAADVAGARSVHPGYGFLSENAAFASAVSDAGLVWIGPPPAAIELMGDKGRAKKAAAAAGVPVVPPADGSSYPLIVKAVAGGGGKGMRVVRSPTELTAATEAARREALASFGDDRVLVERYLERPRHIEVQVLADHHGGYLHIGERECSLQRRHQKIVEEAPSPGVGTHLRTRLGEAAIALARACRYPGVGTVEFIVPKDADEFFFLEMNTRLQVEHPVTEMLYGVDLVEQQFRIAAGEPLMLRQDELLTRGHAVEARLYAEDPAEGFLPVGGTIRLYREPAGPGLRVDSGVCAGSEIGTSYDPMLAKVIAHGPDRATALRRLDRALAPFDIVGVTTNAAFTAGLLRREEVRSGTQDTGLVDRVLAEAGETTPADLVPAAVLAAAGTSRPAGPWRRSLEGYGEARVADGRVGIGEQAWNAAIRTGVGDGIVRVSLGGVERRYAVVVSDEAIWVARDGHHLEVRTAWPTQHTAERPGGSLEAPMPGTVVDVCVAEGDQVAEGDLLVVLESMKMELSITAPAPGTVAGLTLSPGDRVARGQSLMLVKPDGRKESA